MLPASMRFARLLPAVACLTLATAAPASADVRYAAPGGMAFSPCNPAPCSLATAVNFANHGDQVVMAPGAYAQAATLTIDKAIDLGGQLGAVPTIGMKGVQLEVKHAGARLHDVRVLLTEPGMARPLDLRNGIVERVFAADQDLGAGSCFMERGEMRDSVCADGMFLAGAEPGPAQARLVNVTAVPLMVGAINGSQFTASIVNTIAHSPDPSQPDLSVNVSMGSKGAFTFFNSSYETVETTLSSGTDYTFTAPGVGTNQTAPPSFVDAAAADFRQLPSSPTIDAGTGFVGLGAFDLLGAPRSQPRCIGGAPVPDIGAYEFTPTEACPGSGAGSSPAPVQTPPQAVIELGRVRRNLAKGTAKLAVKVPSAGQLRLLGAGVVPRQLRCKSRETVWLPIEAKGSKERKLEERGEVKLRPLVVFTPADGGLPASRSRFLMLKLKLSEG